MNSSNVISVPYFDIQRQHKILALEIEEAVSKVVHSGKYILSDEVSRFEEDFAEYCGAKYAVGVGSGTDALIFAMKALGLGQGDEVLVPAFTFSATVFSILHIGAKPVFVDVDDKTYGLDVQAAERAITSRTRAVLTVHLYGQITNMDKLSALAKKRKLLVIEDACQAHGAKWKEKKAGSFGDAACFSFYPTKNLGAVGDGGIVMTRRADVAEKVRRLRNLGRTNLKKPHEILGWTSRLDAIQASVLRVKLKHLDRFNQQRRNIAGLYKKILLQCQSFCLRKRKTPIMFITYLWFECLAENAWRCSKS